MHYRTPNSGAAAGAASAPFWPSAWCLRAASAILSSLHLNLSNDDAFWLQGFGPMAVNIFAREAQAAWEELFPFADERTLGMAKDHGLPGSAKELASLVDNDRHKFVRLLAGE